MLREISTQRYGKQRVTKKLRELKVALDNEEFLFRGMTKLTTKEGYKHKQEVCNMWPPSAIEFLELKCY
jgi:hypothetical protein